MNTKEAYNKWAETYDSIDNPTRSLDEFVVRTELTNIEGKDIVEAGCGTGKNSLWFANNAKSLKAFDFSEEMLALAKRKVKNTNTHFFIQDITKPWILENEICDIVSINLILEHIKDISFVYKEAYRILRNNGILFICELHPKKQIKGTVAKFTDEKTQEVTKLVSFYHSKNKFKEGAKQVGFNDVTMKDWFDESNKTIPRLLSIKMIK